MHTSELDDAKETNGDLVQGPLPAGTVAPDFTLYATPDQQLSLRELKGNPRDTVVLSTSDCAFGVG